MDKQREPTPQVKAKETPGMYSVHTCIVQARIAFYSQCAEELVIDHGTAVQHGPSK